jgi:hypothetical protein
VSYQPANGYKHLRSPPVGGLFLLKRFVKKILVRALKLILKAKDLKAIVSADGPNLELRSVAVPVADPVSNAIGFAVTGIAYEEARVPSYSIHRSIGDRVP